MTKTNKTLSLILLIAILGTVVFSLSACNDEKDTGFQKRFIRYELFDEEGKLINKDTTGTATTASYGVYRYKYNGKPFKFTVDMIVKGTNERFKNYEEILIDFYKYDEETKEYDHTSGGFQNDELEWPTEIGTYDIHININEIYETIDGKDYAKYHPLHGHLRVIIEE